MKYYNGTDNQDNSSIETNNPAAMSMRVTDSRSYLNEKDNEGGCWKRKTGLEQKLTILSIVLAVIAVGVIIALAVIANRPVNEGPITVRPSVAPSPTQPPKEEVTSPPTTDTTKNPQEKMEICQSEDCKRAAVYYSSTINFNAKPCDDFYEYVCGKWMDSTQLPADKGRFGVFETLRDNLANVSIDQLKKENKAEGSKAIFNSRKLYQECMDTENVTEVEGQAQIQEILNLISGDKETMEFEWFQMLSAILNKFGNSYIISMGIGADAKNTTRNLIYLDQSSSFALARDTYLKPTDKDKPMIAAYKEYAKKVYCLVDNDTMSNDTVSNDTNSDCNLLALEGWADEFYKFEEQLVKFTRSPVERRDAATWYNPMTIEELKQNISSFDWSSFLNSTFEGSGVLVDQNTELIVKEPAYIAKAIDFANNSTITKDYIRVKLAMALGPFLFPAFRDMQFELQKVVNGIKQAKPMPYRCFDLTNDYLGHAVGRLYVESVQFGEDAKKDMSAMVDQLAKAFRELVKANDWMDDATKDASNKKLDQMGEFMGYPDWSKDDKELDGYYEMEVLFGGNFFQNFLTVMEASNKKSMKDLLKENNRTDDWITSASVVNAFYSPTGNSISFPAGILQHPFYQLNRTKAMNYGAIGFVIGHEITHGFDDSGRQYSPEGNLDNWWSNETLLQFTQKKNCFVDQYSAIVDPQTQLNLKGDQTIGENIADNGAIREAYKAYLLSGRVMETLPGDDFKDIDDKKLFFIAAGSVWCTKYRDEELKQQILSGVHSPGQYRSVIPLANGLDFAEAFNCPKGSKMNPDPKDTCVIW